ncbi:hypothetical protein NQ314_004900 [Rhamnusium bicolor]|uniref:NADH dehydrogenase [ubiquinone] 1 alpha subcomplex subunit 1 n=1 Tax=Rhamnusium bicolor TaxID=1586634 RepID=A0AAV8ZI89_9CUCU|nr:hypothetical protein NQ314_004900 [Rhamnusium bicolor]
MWFEILPVFGIITAAMAAPHGIAYILNYLVVGNCFRRSMVEVEQRMQYLRDKRLSGDPYKVKGLENLPEDCENGNGGGNSDECYEMPSVDDCNE